MIPSQFTTLVQEAVHPKYAPVEVRISDRTPSMLGTGLAGSLVELTRQDVYKPKDTIVWSRDKKNSVVHEVTDVKPGYVFTKGTFNSTGDGWIPISDVIGKITRIIEKKHKE